jgi:RNA polymerase-binding transcription factor DksA
MTYVSLHHRPDDGGHPDPAVELDLFQVRERLLALRAQLEDGDPYMNVPDDPASGEHAVVIAVQSVNDQKLAQVLAALVCIEQGTYGNCVDCTRPIQPARLVARPFAIRCVDCQQSADRQSNRGNGSSLSSSQWLAG